MANDNKVIISIDHKQFINLTKREADKAAKKGAEQVLKDAKTYLKTHTKKGRGEAGLAGEIKLEQSKFKGGGWAVEAQGPGNYEEFYATFVELGHFIRAVKKGPKIGHAAPIPYLRSPLAMNMPYIKRQFKDIL